jgi:hypothetical protein
MLLLFSQLCGHRQPKLSASCSWLLGQHSPCEMHNHARETKEEEKKYKEWRKRNSFEKKAWKKHVNIYFISLATRKGSANGWHWALCWIPKLYSLIASYCVGKWITNEMYACIGPQPTKMLRCKFVQRNVLMGFHFESGEVMSPVGKASIFTTVLLHRLMWRCYISILPPPPHPHNWK